MYGQIGKKMRQCVDGCSQLSYRTVAKNVLEGNFVGVVVISHTFIIIIQMRKSLALKMY